MHPKAGNLLRTRRQIIGIPQTSAKDDDDFKTFKGPTEFRIQLIPPNAIVVLLRYNYFFGEEEMEVLYNQNVIFLKNIDSGHDFEILTE